ncbi:MAG TPA: nuclear transport factor 2 family protein [Candidatus Sulfotelmatobacter sp.]|nr:nuclear transport factor 2 family protein [Candidatus Sulfotelmatobacter sp.]
MCCLPVLACAQKALSDESKVLALEKKWTDAYKQHSISSVVSLVNDDFTITVEDGRVFGKTGYISHTADSSVQVDVAEQSDLKVHLHGNVAVVTGAYREIGISNGKRYEYRDRFTDVWIKTGDQWQLLASHYGVPVQE